MDFKQLFDSLSTTLGESFPNIAGAIIIVAIGWLAAIVVRSLTVRCARMFRANERVKKLTDTAVDVESGIGAIAYYLVLILAIIAFFNTLNLGQVATPLESMVEKAIGYLPNLVAGGALVLVAWVLASMLRSLFGAVLSRTSIDSKTETDDKGKPTSQNIASVIYFLTLLLFVPGVLAALKLEGLALPAREMANEILGLVPNLIAAGLIAAAGWMLAKILRSIVTNLLASTRLDEVTRKAGFEAAMPLSSFVGLLVFAFVLVPALVAAFKTLGLEAIADPATQMLSSFMLAIPKLFGAALILAVSYLIANLVSTLVVGLLGGLGFNALPGKLGLAGIVPSGTTASKIAGQLVLVLVMLIAVIESAAALGFANLSGLANSLVELAGRVALGTLVISAGLWFSRFAHDAVVHLGRPNASLVASIARYTVIALALAMGLRTMGIADEIVTNAFSLTLGALAVAFAVAFGLGGRDAASQQVQKWLGK